MIVELPTLPITTYRIRHYASQLCSYATNRLLKLLLATNLYKISFMNRGSKYNLYQCPECTYGTTRKYNLKVHMERMHGLDLSPYRYTSQKEWVWAQRSSLEQAYIQEAETDKEKKEAERKLNNFLIRWGRKGYWDFIGAIVQAEKARYQQEEKNKKKKVKSYPATG